MKKDKQIFSIANMASAMLMILTLLWLSLSTPFVYAAEQASIRNMEHANWQADDSNPFSGTTEEKNESSVNTLSEYLHDLQHDNHHFVQVEKSYKCHPSDIYFEFHPELISPPPEV